MFFPDIISDTDVEIGEGGKNMEVIYGGKYSPVGDSEKCVVFQARNNETGENTGLKRLPAHRAEAMVELRIWREVYPEMYRSHFMENGWLYIEREWIRGVTLCDYVEKNGSLKAEEALRIILLVSEELKRFYDKTGFVHGDLTPDNIITDGTILKIIDFESAGPERLVGDMKKSSKKRTLKFMSEGFSAPEILNGEVTLRSDFYSLGKLLLFITDESNDEIKKLTQKLTAEIPGDRHESIESIIAEINGLLRKETKLVKSKLFRNNVFGYRKLIIYVPGNFSFASELATCFSENNVPTGCVEICDYGKGVAGYYMKEKQASRSYAEELIASESFTPYGADSKKNSEPFLSRNYKRNGKMAYATKIAEDDCIGNVDTMRDFMVNCYADFDVTVICDECFIGHENKAQLMRFSDYVIIPVEANSDELENVLFIYNAFCEDNGIPKERLLCVAWNYAEGESVEETVFENNGNTYLGRIDHDAKRAKLKNLEGKYYTDEMDEHIRSEYNAIIGKILSL